MNMAMTLGNPAALWGLLAVPAILAIHFFQQRSRRVVVSTRFLLEALAPESRGGRTWEKLRHSRALWLQLLAVLLTVWVLLEPRWPREESAQTIVAVLDHAIAMQAGRDEAVTAVQGIFARSEGRAARTTWVVMTSDPRQPPLYRGPDRAEAGAAAARWQPALGTHDYAPALRLAQSLAGGSGLVWFVTDTREKVPSGVAAVGVGRAFANIGFASGAVRRGADGEGWRALVKNHSAEAQTRQWWIEYAGGRTPAQELALGAEGVSELSGPFPPGTERCELVLAGDRFSADDRLPLVRPHAKKLTVRMNLGGGGGGAASSGAGEKVDPTAEFFRKLFAGLEGVEFTSALNPGLRVVTEDGNWATPKGAAIVLAQKITDTGPGASAQWSREALVAERHALVADLNWQGLLGPGPSVLKPEAADEVLLWQGGRPLVWVRSGAGGGVAARQLVLNFDWAAGNAARLPATVLLLRRFVAEVQAAQAGAYAANFDAGAPVPLAEADWADGKTKEPVRIEREDASVAAASPTPPVTEVNARAGLRAPGAAGFFKVRRGAKILVEGAAQFSDVRQSDFHAAETFVIPPPAGAETAARERGTRGDPYVSLWLALAGAALLGSWWPAQSGGRKSA